MIKDKKWQKMKQKLATVPKKPGVYRFYGAGKEIIYIGKASNLKNRLSSYFVKKGDRELKTKQMVAEAKDFSWQIAGSEIEAIILETLEIKKYLPRYNIKVKDSKDFLYLIIGTKYPQKPELVRASEAKGRYVYGPFTESGSAREALKFIRRVFPFRDCSDTKFRLANKRQKPCLQYFIKNCPGPCAGKCSKSEYQKNIKNVKLFFEGKKQRIIASLKKEMKQASKTQSYEKAARIRDQIRALEHIEGTAAITHKEKRGVALSELGKVLGLKIDIGFRVEAYDISNLFGKEATGSMVVFSGGIPQKEEYRKFKIKTVDSINDYAMFSEVFRRRFSGTHKDWADPDLIILDGGQGQLRIVREVLRRLGVKIPILAIAKSPSRKKIDLYFEKDGKFHYIPTSKVGTELINLLTQIREEAHRFAISYHKILRRKNLIGK